MSADIVHLTGKLFYLLLCTFMLDAERIAAVGIYTRMHSLQLIILTRTHNTH